ncbi:hypothetical protein SK803_20775 [Lentzea sp. BCCO 10_0856]|uniref:Secreted protein n=1 Tax=Lentzea miocenica TaxID=3095431 RepID=A0ABU4T3B2_9PSEU|nr:hypothetical protein [Lentzea sp. BCCO 10_0856]MDX8032656.1 hypothetical protein [Lentzea sp. BCCO 10_0856]
MASAQPPRLRGGFRYLTVFLSMSGWVDLTGVSLSFTPACQAVYRAWSRAHLRLRTAEVTHLPKSPNSTFGALPQLWS